MKKITLFLIALTFSFTAMAAAMHGTYKVGTNGTEDFASLSAAVTALNTNGVDGDVVLEITSDITEAANIGLGVNTGSYSITIRPDVVTDPNTDPVRTITFTQLDDNKSPTGHFVIGYTTAGLTSAWTTTSLIPTNNVTINGYAVGGTTKRLTFTNTNAAHVGARVIVVVGACQNTVVKNCIINNLTTNTGSPFCIGAVIRKIGTVSTDAEYAPSNFTIENCTLTATGNNVAMGARITNSNTPLTAKLTGFVFKNNIVTARRRLLEINYTTGGEISGNSFTTLQTGAPGSVSYGLWTYTAVDGTIKIFNNKFLKSTTEETGAYGHRAVSLSSGATYEIYNNTFAGMDKTIASTAALNLTYLFYSGVAGKIYNNTFYMPALTNPTQSGGYYRAINLSGNTAEIKNNIFISNEPTHTNTSFISGVPTPATDYNVYYIKQPHTGATVVSTYATLGDYQTANTTKDRNSKNIDVNFSDAATGNLNITGASIGDYNLAVPRQATVLTDITGTTNRAALTYAGAYEASDLTTVAKQFSVTVPNGTAKVYIAGNFTGKDWDITTPFELTKSTTTNVFNGIFPCVDGVTYKYLCEKTGDWDYQEAIYQGADNPIAAPNRTYSATDIVPIWYRVNKIVLNTTFSGVVPATLFVKNSGDNWTTPTTMTKTGNTFSVTLGGNVGDKIAANFQYKYYTNDDVQDNWESNADGSPRDNRWSIAPVMNDVIERFTTQITTENINLESSARIMTTATGVEVILSSEATIELYTINGMLLDKVKTSSYSRDLNNGVYIIRINGKATKFIK